MLGSLQGLSVIERMEKQAEFAFAGAKKSVHSLVCFVRMEEECLVLFCHFFKQFSIFMCWLTFCHCWALKMGWGISVKVLLETIQKRTTFLFLFNQSEAEQIMTWPAHAYRGFPEFDWLIASRLFWFSLLNAAVRRVPWTQKSISTLEMPWHKDKEWESFLGGLGFPLHPSPHLRFAFVVVDQLRLSLLSRH